MLYILEDFNLLYVFGAFAATEYENDTWKIKHQKGIK
jgi:hypothetical protein